MRFLYAITTYDAYAYVDLSLTLVKDKMGIDCIVLDDGSYSSKLQEVCDKHKVFLIGKTNSKTPLWCRADLANTINAIRYADFNGYDYVIKCSRRWICIDNPIKSLLSLIIRSNGNTFGMWDKNIYNFSNGITKNFDFRTQFMCLKVKQWMNVVDRMDQLTDHYTLQSHGLVEDIVHEYAKQIQPKDSKYLGFVHGLRTELKSPNTAYGFVPWSWIGDTKNQPPDYILWHQKNTPQQYAEIAQHIGLNYKTEDFILDQKEKIVK